MEYSSSLVHEDSKSSSGDENEDTRAAGTGRSYECVFCKRGFTTAQALGGHMNIHRKDRAKNRPTSSIHNKNDEILAKSYVPIQSYPHPYHHHHQHHHMNNYNSYFAGGSVWSNTPSQQHVHHHHGQDSYSNYYEAQNPQQHNVLGEDYWNLSLQVGNPSRVDDHNNYNEDKRGTSCEEEEEEEEELDLELRLGHA